MKVLVDGTPAGKTHCNPGVSGKRLGLSTDTPGTYRPFQFAALQTTGALTSYVVFHSPSRSSALPNTLAPTA